MQFRHPGFFQFIQADIFLPYRAEIVLVFGCVGKRVNFVENEYHRFLGFIYFLQGLVYHFQLLLKVGVGDIHHVQQQVGFAHLVEGRFERFYQVGGQFADKAHRVGQQERQIVDNYLPHRGVQCGKEFVFRKNIRLTQ